MITMKRMKMKISSSWDVESDHEGGITHHIIIDEDSHHVDETHRQKTLPVKEYIQMLKKQDLNQSRIIVILVNTSKSVNVLYL